jgi:hypothetical protein
MLRADELTAIHIRELNQAAEKNDVKLARSAYAHHCQLQKNQ